MNIAEALHDDEKALLLSPEGMAAFQILLPLLRGLAMAIAGRGQRPPELECVPDIDADVRLERARLRAKGD